MKLINSLLIVTLAGATSLAQNPLQNPAISAAHNAAHTASQPNAPAKTPAASTKPSTPATTAAKAKADAPAKGAATMAKAPVHETKSPVVKKEVAKEKPVAAEKKATPFTPKKTVTAKT